MANTPEENQELQTLATEFGEPLPVDTNVVDPNAPPQEEFTKGSVAKGLNAGILRAPAQALGGAIDLASDLGGGAGNIIGGAVTGTDSDFVNKKLIPHLHRQFNTKGKPLNTLSTFGSALKNFGDKDGDGNTDFNDVLSGKDGIIGRAGNDTVNQLTTEVGSVLVAFGGLRSLATNSGKVPGLLQAGKGAIAADIAIGSLAGQVLDPDNERLSNVLLNFGVKDPFGFIEGLANLKDEDESRTEARLSMLVEDSVVGGAVEGLFRLGRFGIQSFRGNQQAASDIVDEVVGDLPNPAAQEGANVVDEAAEEVVEDALGTAVDEVADTSVVDTLNGVRERAGVDIPEFAGELPLNSGRIVVPDEAAGPLNDVARADGSNRDVFIPESQARGNTPITDTATIRDDFVQSLAKGDPYSPSQATFSMDDTSGVYAALESVAQNLTPLKPKLPPKTGDAPVPVREDADVFNDAVSRLESMGLDQNTGLEFVREIAGQTANLDEAVRAAQIFTNRVYKDLDDIALDSIDDLSEDALQDVFQRVHNAYLVGEQYTRIGTGLGRGLRARQALKRDDYIETISNPQRSLKMDQDLALGSGDIPGLPYSRGTLKTWLQDFHATQGQPRVRNAMLKDAATVPGAGQFFGNSLANLFSTNILSGLYTFSTNIIAPVVIAPTRTAAKMLGGTSRAAILQASGNPQAAKEAVERSLGAARAHAIAAGQAAQMVGELSARLVSGGKLRLAPEGSLASRNADGVTQAFQRGNSVLRSGNFLDVMSETKVAWKGNDAFTNFQKTGYALGNGINVFPRVFRRFAAGVDEVANRISYTGEMSYHLMTEAQRHGFSGQAARDFVDRRLPGALNEANQASSQSTLREAQRTTLTYTPGTPGGASEKFISNVNALRKNVPLVRTIMPVFNVPMNGVGELLRSIPFAHKFLDELASDVAGHRGAALQEEAYGRYMVASGIMFMGYQMSLSGKLTGEGPSKPRARRRWMEAGNQPNSIKVGDEWVDYTRFDQIGGLLGLIAGFNDKTVAGVKADNEKNYFTGGAAILASYFRDRSALQGITRIMNAETDGQNSKAIEMTLASVASSIAVPTLLASSNNIDDPVLRKRNSIGESIQARIPLRLANLIPGVDTVEDLDPMLNSLGEVQYKRRNDPHENIFPFLHSKDISSSDPLMETLEDMYQISGGTTGILTDGDLGGNGGIKPRFIKIEDAEDLEEDDERGWNITTEITFRRGNLRIDGKNLRESLEELVLDEEFQDDDKFAWQGGNNTFTLGVNSKGEQRRSRNKLISAVFQRYTAAAKADLFANSETYRRATAVIALRRGGGVALNEIKTSDIIKTPSILEGINIGSSNAHDLFLELSAKPEPKE